ncbi:MAG: DUF3089 domain-containing protein [Spirochaetia bacterium]|nr:DUF3089 domain-containing protein [Spirochaetia bacterium]
MKRCISLLWLFIVLASLLGCTSTQAGEQNPYADTSQWLALPQAGNADVDVFYLYPTVYARPDATAPLYSTRDDAQLRSSAGMAYLLEAAVFEQVGAVYAPIYRQGDAASILALPFEERDVLLEQAPLEDALASFDYFIKHYNNQRPFILVGHSQGSDVLRLLLATYMEAHPEVYDRMIAAYCIGCSITSDFLAEHPFLKFAAGSDDTGVIISYNTEAPGVTEENPLIDTDALVINPISWTRGEEPAQAEENLGSALLDQAGKLILVPEFADATLDLNRSVVTCSTVEGKLPQLASSAFLPKGVYHSFDISLYAQNLVENARVRTAAYLAAH